MIPNVYDLIKCISVQIDYFTCLECCRYFKRLSTAPCGHNLCQRCWSGRQKCAECAAPVEKKSLMLNLQLQSQTECVYQLVQYLEKYLNINLKELALTVPDESNKEPNENVQDWLANSQNHFSNPVSQFNSQLSLQGIQPLEPVKSLVQNETNNLKTASSPKVKNIPMPQDDWDKIELMVDTEEYMSKKHENITGPLNIEPFDNKKYTTENPRRSMRKSSAKDFVSHEVNEKHQSNKTKQTWNIVKSMRQEFNKLNKKNSNKLNVSIESCKRTQVLIHNTKFEKNITKTPEIIENFTPNIIKKQKALMHLNLNPKDSDSLTLNPKSLTSNESNESVKDNCHENSVHVTNCSDVNKKTQGLSNTKNYMEKQAPQVKFFKKSKLSKENYNHKDINNMSKDDIEISIRIGETITKICIIKNEKENVQFKINTDQGIQTTLRSQNVTDPLKKVSNLQNIPIQIQHNANEFLSTEVDELNSGIPQNNVLDKSISTKKNTADTATVQFEMTKSVEKELSDIMECVEAETVQSKSSDKMKTNQFQILAETESQQNHSIKQDIPRSNGNLDCHLLQTPVQLLKTSKNIPSIILKPQWDDKIQNKSYKRNRDINNENELPTKKKKIETSEKKHAESDDSKQLQQSQIQQIEYESKHSNYDEMSQVIASSVPEIEDVKTNKHCDEKAGKISKNRFQFQYKKNHNASQILKSGSLPSTDNENQKCSENIFSIIEHDENFLAKEGMDLNTLTNQENVEPLTPNICQEFTSACEDDGKHNKNNDNEMQELGTPCQDIDDSDKSVVEDTPQKNASITKIKQKSDSLLLIDVEKENTILTLSSHQKRDMVSDNKQNNFENMKNLTLVNLSDSISESTKTKKILNIMESSKKPQGSLESPYTNTFAEQIKHKSTPIARKSLNFDYEVTDDNDPEQTMHSTAFAVAKTTQEKEFMNEVFEQVPSSMVHPLFSAVNQHNKLEKICVAGSCLTLTETANLKRLCAERGWTYVDKFTKDLTHLVVCVDNENKSQRSVKFMSALAAGKWIISYAWIEKCIETKSKIPEELYEALDMTGEPGPRRSRVAKQKLFQGIKFYCMEPFSILNVETLKYILEAAGGQVMNSPREVKVVDDNPALLLADPENTQEYRFIYLAIELHIVPVNYEWVLNCLGSYTLNSIHEHLMCPLAVLPPMTAKWPNTLMDHEDD